MNILLYRPKPELWFVFCCKSAAFFAFYIAIEIVARSFHRSQFLCNKNATYKLCSLFLTVEVVKFIMDKRFFIFILVVFCGLICRAQHTVGADQKPRMVVGISIEHVRMEYLDRYWDSFQNDGFKRMVRTGNVCRNTRLDLQTINAATGTATLYSGTMPALHGIVGNEWYRQLTRERKYATKDPYFMTVGSDSDEGGHSAVQLKASTLGDVLKMQTGNKSKVYSVALNPHAAVLSAGHSADGAYWFDGTNGNFISSSYFVDRFPEWVRNYNNQRIADTYLNGRWETLLPIGSYTAGFADDYNLEPGFWKLQNTFPYDLKKLSAQTDTPYSILKATPFGNKMVKDFASKLIEETQLGLDEHPDLLAITFSSLDFANGWYEPASVEMHDLYLRLDQDIAQLLQTLDQQVGRDQYVVFLTGVSTTDYSAKVRKKEFNFPGGEFAPQSALALLRSYLNVLYGAGDWVAMYNEEQIYLNHDLLERKEMRVDEMQQKVAMFLNQFEGVRAALPAYSIENGNLNNQRFRAIENSFYTQRSGDVVLLLEEGWRPVNRAYTIDYSSENRVPLLFYGAKVQPGINYTEVQTIDIVPTLCKVLGIVPPDDAQGKVIEGVF